MLQSEDKVTEETQAVMLKVMKDLDEMITKGVQVPTEEKPKEKVPAETASTSKPEEKKPAEKPKEQAPASEEKKS